MKTKNKNKKEKNKISTKKAPPRTFKRARTIITTEPDKYYEMCVASGSAFLEHNI